MTRRAAILLASLLCVSLVRIAAAASAPTSPPPGVAVFVPDAAPPSALHAEPVPPSFVGLSVRRDANGGLVPLTRPRVTAAGAKTGRQLPATLAYGDYYVLDGSESAVAVNPSDGQNVVAGYNEGWDFNPDIPISNSTTGNTLWTARVFPVGQGVYQGYPFGPWCVSGNAPGEFFTTLIRHDLFPTDNSHIVVSHSTDTGTSFTKFCEVPKDVFQDRSMMDIDRPAALGGTSGPHDGKLYLCYDDYGPAGSGYVGSFLRVMSPAGDSLIEVQLSGTGAVPFRGNQFQPVAGGVTNPDGSVYFVSSAVSGGGATAIAYFHEIAGAGGGTKTYLKSTLTWAPAGQRLGATQRWGVNGHRIDNRGFLAIDRSSGGYRSRLYFITNRNPNPADPTKDQGDIYLSYSTSGGTSWNTARVPTSAGRTQFFPMLDVDAQGWIHVAYYENGSGLENNGVLNAGSANVLYTVSRDGGRTWTPALQVNETANKLVLEDPPIELGAFDYYMIGDYMQLRAVGVGSTTTAYVVWTGYDKWRNDEGMGTKKERVMATRVGAPIAPGASPGNVALLALALACTGAVALFARRRAPGPERVLDDA
jgi:hypothetical protein